ncbi:MAG: DUF4867 family protein [Eubacteriaceae bacterium]|nr:DUF4867 family protein [Eubacteriaceae bacterium]
MDLLQRLNEANDIEIISCNDERFERYGRILQGFNTSMIMDYMERSTPLPRSGCVYIASDAVMEKLPIIEEISLSVFGTEAVQAGYCNGASDAFNGFEYHKDIEVNICVNDLMLAVAKTADIKNNTISSDDAKVFFFPRGTVVEIYGDTLHYAPLKACEPGYRAVVILPRDTNVPLTMAEEIMRNKKFSEGYAEAKLLMQKRKWVIAHPDNTVLIQQGGYPGMLGENKKIAY